VIASSAERARSTAEVVIEDGGLACPLRVEAALYGAGAEGVLGVIREASPTIGRLLVVGHQPWCSELVALLAGGGAVAFPTATVACLDAGHLPWSALGPGGAVLRWLLPPRLLP
jgi:phosphohistidine phosphatase